MVVLERGEIPNQVWNDIYIYFLRPFIIVFFFDLSSARRTGMLSASFHLLVATLFLHCCFATQRLLPGGRHKASNLLGRLCGCFCNVEFHGRCLRFPRPLREVLAARACTLFVPSPLAGEGGRRPGEG